MRVCGTPIRLLARYQGNKNDDWRDEEPGKILHELRRGELANLNEIPQTPYYGAVDSTPLFLILVGEHANWTKTSASTLREHCTGLITAVPIRTASIYRTQASPARVWEIGAGKDSGDSVMNADGSLATPPITLVEVQGYCLQNSLTTRVRAFGRNDAGGTTRAAGRTSIGNNPGRGRRSEVRDRNSTLQSVPTIHFQSSYQARGGTDIYSCLKSSFSPPQRTASRLRLAVSRV